MTVADEDCYVSCTTIVPPDEGPPLPTTTTTSVYVEHAPVETLPFTGWDPVGLTLFAVVIIALGLLVLRPWKS